MSGRFEFWFDFSCPYAYLASTRVDYLQARTNARLEPKPFLLGAVHRALGGDGSWEEEGGAAKLEHTFRDIIRHARAFEVPVRVPEGHPFRPGLALQCLMALEGDVMPLANAFFRAYWVEGRDVSDRRVVADVLSAQGQDPASLLEQADSPEAKGRLEARTQEALERGIFGAPSFVVGSELFWGVDRIHLVEEALGGRPTCPFPEVRKDGLVPVDVWFDYSSPFSYIGVSRARDVLGPAARLRPMLLGAVFDRVGQAMVPMLEFSEAKRRYLGRELERETRAAGLPFRYPSRFPIRSVNALRLTLAAQLEGHDPWGLVERIFRAYWAEDRDISQLPVLEGLAEQVGLDGASLIDHVRDSKIKEALFLATDEAVASGVFGAPTFVVHHRDGERSLYWGSDRLYLAAQAAAGHTAVY